MGGKVGGFGGDTIEFVTVYGRAMLYLQCPNRLHRLVI